MMTRRGGAPFGKSCDDVFNRSLSGELHRSGSKSKAFGAQAHLRHSLLARDVDRAVFGLRHQARRLDQQRRLADAGIAAQQQHRAAHKTAAGDAVELGHAGRKPRRVLALAGEQFELEGAALALGAKADRAAGSTRRVLFRERIPLAARLALALPAAKGGAAVLADEGEGGFGHGGWQSARCVRVLNSMFAAGKRRSAIAIAGGLSAAADRLSARAIERATRLPADPVLRHGLRCVEADAEAFAHVALAADDLIADRQNAVVDLCRRRDFTGARNDDRRLRVGRGRSRAEHNGRERGSSCAFAARRTASRSLPPNVRGRSRSRSGACRANHDGQLTRRRMRPRAADSAPVVSIPRCRRQTWWARRTAGRLCLCRQTRFLYRRTDIHSPSGFRGRSAGPAMSACRSPIHRHRSRRSGKVRRFWRSRKRVGWDCSRRRRGAGTAIPSACATAVRPNKTAQATENMAVTRIVLFCELDIGQPPDRN